MIVSVIALLMAPLSASKTTHAEEPQVKGKIRVYIGSYTRGTSEGIYVSELDLDSGKLAQPRLAAKAVNPSFLAIHPNHKFLYAVGEIDNFDGKQTGGVSALTINPKDGRLTLINQKSSQGAGPCYLVVDHTGKCVLVANYGGGSVACLPIGDDGSLSEATTFIQHEGSSVNPQRQAGPHAHSINVDAANRFAVAADLGLDKLFVYRLDAARGKLTSNDPPSVSVPPGGGPRHLVFHPSGRFAYVNNEINCTVTAFSYDAEKGKLTKIHTTSTLPVGVKVKSSDSTAEVRVHPNGRFLYVSNRGHNSIAIFAIDPSTGKLAALGHESTRGKIPRNFNLDPSGRYLIAANQDSDNVVVFRVDAKTGLLEPTGSEIEVGSPVCVRFLEIDD